MGDSFDYAYFLTIQVVLILVLPLEPAIYARKIHEFPWILKGNFCTLDYILQQIFPSTMTQLIYAWKIWCWLTCF